MATSQQLLVPGVGGTPSITSTHPTLDLDPEYGLGTTGARKLTASLKQGFQLADKIDPGTQDFWFAGWVKLASLLTPWPIIIDTGSVSSNHPGFMIRIDSGVVHVYLHDGTTLVHQLFDTTLSVGTWYFLVVTFDRDGACKCYIDSAAESTTLDISTANGAIVGYNLVPTIGYRIDGYYSTYAYDGSLSRLLYGEGSLPTEAEIAQLYNGGQGLTYAELPASIEAKVKHAWNCMEASDGTGPVPLYDAKGTNDGTEVWAQ